MVFTIGRRPTYCVTLTGQGGIQDDDLDGDDDGDDRGNGRLLIELAKRLANSAFDVAQSEEEEGGACRPISVRRAEMSLDVIRSYLRSQALFWVRLAGRLGRSDDPHVSSRGEEDAPFRLALRLRISYGTRPRSPWRPRRRRGRRDENAKRATDTHRAGDGVEQQKEEAEEEDEEAEERLRAAYRNGVAKCERLIGPLKARLASGEFAPRVGVDDDCAAIWEEVCEAMDAGDAFDERWDATPVLEDERHQRLEQLGAVGEAVDVLADVDATRLLDHIGRRPLRGADERGDRGDGGGGGGGNDRSTLMIDECAEALALHHAFVLPLACASLWYWKDVLRVERQHARQEGKEVTMLWRMFCVTYARAFGRMHPSDAVASPAHLSGAFGPSNGYYSAKDTSYMGGDATTTTSAPTPIPSSSAPITPWWTPICKMSVADTWRCWDALMWRSPGLVIGRHFLRAVHLLTLRVATLISHCGDVSSYDCARYVSLPLVVAKHILHAEAGQRRAMDDGDENENENENNHHCVDDDDDEATRTVTAATRDGHVLVANDAYVSDTERVCHTLLEAAWSHSMLSGCGMLAEERGGNERASRRRRGTRRKRRRRRRQERRQSSQHVRVERPPTTTIRHYPIPPIVYTRFRRMVRDACVGRAADIIAETFEARAWWRFLFWDEIERHVVQSGARICTPHEVLGNGRYSDCDLVVQILRTIGVDRLGAGDGGLIARWYAALKHRARYEAQEAAGDEVTHCHASPHGHAHTLPWEIVHCVSHERDAERASKLPDGIAAIAIDEDGERLIYYYKESSRRVPAAVAHRIQMERTAKRLPCGVVSASVISELSVEFSTLLVDPTARWSPFETLLANRRYENNVIVATSESNDDTDELLTLSVAPTRLASLRAQQSIRIMKIAMENIIVEHENVKGALASEQGGGHAEDNVASSGQSNGGGMSGGCDKDGGQALPAINVVTCAATYESFRASSAPLCKAPLHFLSLTALVVNGGASMWRDDDLVDACRGQHAMRWCNGGDAPAPALEAGRCRATKIVNLRGQYYVLQQSCSLLNGTPDHVPQGGHGQVPFQDEEEATERDVEAQRNWPNDDDGCFSDDDEEEEEEEEGAPSSPSGWPTSVVGAAAASEARGWPLSLCRPCADMDRALYVWALMVECDVRRRLDCLYDGLLSLERAHQAWKTAEKDATTWPQTNGDEEEEEEVEEEEDEWEEEEEGIHDIVQCVNPVQYAYRAEQIRVAAVAISQRVPEKVRAVVGIWRDPIFGQSYNERGDKGNDTEGDERTNVGIYDFSYHCHAAGLPSDMATTVCRWDCFPAPMYYIKRHAGIATISPLARRAGTLREIKTRGIHRDGHKGDNAMTSSIGTASHSPRNSKSTSRWKAIDL